MKSKTTEFAVAAIAISVLIVLDRLFFAIVFEMIVAFILIGFVGVTIGCFQAYLANAAGKRQNAEILKQREAELKVSRRAPKSTRRPTISAQKDKNENRDEIIIKP